MEKLVKEVHSVRGADSQIVERGMNSIVVNMEDNVFSSKIMSQQRTEYRTAYISLTWM
jgi:hypothetical protein